MAHDWEKDVYTLIYRFQGKRGLFLTVVVLLLIVGLWTSGLPAEAARLENPGDGQVYSGIGIISGWKYDADGPLTIRFNGGPPAPLVYGSEHTDTRSVCSDANNGFVALWNWAALGEGLHIARVYDNGVAFAETTFQVGTPGVEFWDGVECRPANPDVCTQYTFSHTMTSSQFGVDGEFGYDGEWWASPGTGFDTWNTYFKWNANTQHFEAFGRRRYQPYEPPEPPEAWRWQEPSFEDRPDDFDGPQIHVYHAEPRDARGSRDMIGYIGAVVQAVQRWLAARTYQGRAFRIDTYQDIPDVTSLPLDVTTAEMQAYNLPEAVFDAPILQGGLSLRDIGSHDPNKLHVIFIEAPPAIQDSPSWISTCGVASPSSGVAVLFAGSPFLSIHGNRFCNGFPIAFLHEVFHLLGAVHPDAPHSDGTSHIEDKGLDIDEGSFDEDGQRVGKVDRLPKRSDLMQPSPNPDAELDIGSDDYYFHPEKTPYWPPPHYDTVDSPYFTDGPWTDITRAVPSHALRAAPPEGQPAIAPDNPSEAAPYLALPEPQPEGQGGRISGEWCGGVVD